MISILIGCEIFGLQSAGGISRIYQETLPIIRKSGLVDEIRITRSRGLPLLQEVSHLSDSRIGVKRLRENCRPFKLRCEANRRLFDPLNSWLFARAHADVYMPTYYTCPPPGVPSICFVYDMTHERHPDSFLEKSVAETVERKRTAIKAATRCICISQQTKHDLVSMYGVEENCCDVVYLGGGESIEVPESCEDTEDDIFQILYVGYWEEPYKNFEFMLEALKRFRPQQGQNVKLHVVSRRRASLTMREQHSVLSGVQIIYHEMLSDEDLNSLYRKCDAFVYPSLWEGFGIPLVEAMARGCPVVCSDIPVFKEVGGDAVDYFDPTDKNSFCAAMDRAQTSGRGLVVVQKRMDRAKMFTWENCANGILESIKKVVRA